MTEKIIAGMGARLPNWQPLNTSGMAPSNASGYWGDLGEGGWTGASGAGSQGSSAAPGPLPSLLAAPQIIGQGPGYYDYDSNARSQAVAQSSLQGMPLGPLEPLQPLQGSGTPYRVEIVGYNKEASALAAARASMNDYWGSVADAGVSDGSFFKYSVGQAMQWAGNVGYSLVDMGVAVYNSPEQSLAGGLKSVVNFGPEAFNGATNLVKTSLNGYSMLAEKLGAGEGAFTGFRDSAAYNITPLYGYDNQAQAGGAVLTQLALGAGLAKYGNYSIELNVGGAGALSANPLSLRLVKPASADVGAGIVPNSVEGASYLGDPYSPHFVGPVQWEYFYRGDSALRSEFLSSMAQTNGLQATESFLGTRSTGALGDILAEHGVSSSTSPFVSTSRNPAVAEYFARGPSQTQNGVVTTFRVEAREAAALRDQGRLVPNFENPMSFFDPNPAIGLPEAEFLFGSSINPRYIYQQVPLKGIR